MYFNFRILKYYYQHVIDIKIINEKKDNETVYIL